MPKAGLVQLGRQHRFCPPPPLSVPANISPVNWQRGSESAGLFPSGASEDSAKVQQQSTEAPDS